MCLLLFIVFVILQPLEFIFWPGLLFILHTSTDIVLVCSDLFMDLKNYMSYLFPLISSDIKTDTKRDGNIFETPIISN